MSSRAVVDLRVRLRTGDGGPRTGHAQVPTRFGLVDAGIVALLEQLWRLGLHTTHSCMGGDPRREDLCPPGTVLDAYVAFAPGTDPGSLALTLAATGLKLAQGSLVPAPDGNWLVATIGHRARRGQGHLMDCPDGSVVLYFHHHDVPHLTDELARLENRVTPPQ